MKMETFLGWLGELETTSTAGGGWIDELDAAPGHAGPATGLPAPGYEHWRVFAALAAMPLRAAGPALNRPS